MSSEKFDLLIEEEMAPTSEIESKGMHDHVFVHVRVSDTAEVATGRKKQDVMVVDSSGSGKCVCFEKKRLDV